MQTSDNLGEKPSKTVMELKAGDRFYGISNNSIKWYTYFCAHPNNSRYHIVFDMNEDPLRIWEDNLQDILDRDLTSYEEARLKLADVFEQRAKDLRKRATHKSVDNGTYD